MPKQSMSMEMKQCPVCGELHCTGILLDKKLLKRLEEQTVTGLQLCPEHDRLFQEGYIAIIVTTDVPEDRSKGLPVTATRTGDIAHVRREVLRELTDLTEDALASPIIFAGQAFFEKLAEICGEPLPKDTDPCPAD